jgi:hypothetical protein
MKLRQLGDRGGGNNYRGCWMRSCAVLSWQKKKKKKKRVIVNMFPSPHAQALLILLLELLRKSHF